MIINIEKTIETIKEQAATFAVDNDLHVTTVFAAMLVGASIVLAEESRNL